MATKNEERRYVVRTGLYEEDDSQTWLATIDAAGWQTANLREAHRFTRREARIVFSAYAGAYGTKSGDKTYGVRRLRAKATVKSKPQDGVIYEKRISADNTIKVTLAGEMVYVEYEPDGCEPERVAESHVADLPDLVAALQAAREALSNG